MGRNEQTSKEVASKAARVLRDPNASAEAKSVAASALSQAPDTGTDGPVGRLSPKGPSPETTPMTKKSDDKDDKTKVAENAEDKKSAGATDEQKSDETNKESAEEASKNAEEAEADRASRGDPNAGAQDEGRAAKGPGQDSGETMKTIDAEDLTKEPAELGRTDGLENEDVVLTDHDPASKPDEPVNKLEKDQLHHASDGRIRTGDDKVAWAPPGSYDAAKNGVQQDASGAFTSANLPGGARVVDGEAQKTD